MIYLLPQSFFQPQAVGDNMPRDKNGDEYQDYEVWESREQCQALFPHSEILEYKRGDIGCPLVYFSDGNEVFFEE